MIEAFIDAPNDPFAKSPPPEDGLSKREDEVEPISTEYTWTIPLSIDTSGERFLDDNQVSAPKNASIPREIIAEEICRTRFQAELSRPLRLGQYGRVSAYLLCFAFSFQQLSSRTRVRQAVLTISFEDAPADGCNDGEAGFGTTRPPAILDYYPRDYEGPASAETARHSTQLPTTSSGVRLGESLPSLPSGEGKALEGDGRLIVHGWSDGRPVKHQVVWTIKGNKTSKDMIPRTVRFPLVVKPHDRRRFSVGLIVNAHYGIRRGPSACVVPVLGKYEHPIYFDPATLETMAKAGENSEAVVAETGDLAQCNLAEYSSFKNE